MARRLDPLRALVLLALASTAAACSHSVVVRAPVLLPAQVPVRAFPSIWVAGGGQAEEAYLLDRLAAHLAQDGRREVRRVDLAELEPAREAGEISPLTVVVLLQLSFRDAVTRFWDTAPVQYCGYYGCSIQYDSYLVTALEVTGEVNLTVYEGPTARVLQSEKFDRNAIGDQVEPLKAQILEQLATDLDRAVDVLRTREKLTLYRVDMPDVEAALKAIERGKWDEGRQALERAAKQLGGHDKRTQARVWYDLGVARWFAPGKDGLTQAAYEAADRAFGWAARLDPQPAHLQVRARLRKARERFAVLEEQRRATAYNFSIAEQHKTLPAAPVLPPGAEPMDPTNGPAVPAPDTAQPPPVPAPAEPAKPAREAPGQPPKPSVPTPKPPAPP